LKALLSTEINIALPNTGVTATVQRFHFKQMLASLLTDPTTMQPENVFINLDNPFAEPITPSLEKPDEVYDDFNSGQSHRNAWERLCWGKQPRQTLCEVTIFMDNTYLNIKEKHTLKPILCTLEIFNCQFRNKPDAWRLIGYIPNVEHLAGNASPLKKNKTIIT
jgi:hypothetical protein